MLSTIYAKLASIFLSKIIPSVDTKQISVQNKDGLLTLENLEINPVLLIKEKIPFNIKRGTIKSMKISIDPLPNGLIISCNDIILFCDSKQANVFYHFFSSFVSSIGTFFDFTKIKIEVENFHFICYNKDEKTINTLLSVKIPTISSEPILNEGDTSNHQRNLRFLSISISFYNLSNTTNIIFNEKISDIPFDEFINKVNSIFINSDDDKIIKQSLTFNEFSISCIINSNDESSDIKIESDDIHIKSELNQFYQFINSHQNVEEKYKIQNLWGKTLKYYLKTKSKPNFNINTALSFLKNREKYVNLISTETDSEKVDQFFKETEIDQETQECLKIYTNDALSEKFNVTDQISSQINRSINFTLSIPTISIEFQDESQPILSLKFDQLKGEYHFENKMNKGTFQINDFSINGTKVSESQPFLISQDDKEGQIIHLSKCILVIKKEYENDSIEKVDYLKMLDIEKQLKEYKTLFQLINILGQSRKLNHFMFLGNKRNKMTFKSDSCLIHLQYYSKNKEEKTASKEEENQNISELPKFDFLISINSYTIQFERFKFKDALIDFEGLSLNKNQMLLPFKLSIKLKKLMNSLFFSSELFELKMNGVYFKKSIDIFKAIQSVLNIRPNIDLIVNIDEIKIHLSVNLIMSCRNFISKQKFSEHFSSSFNEFKIMDCNRLFLSFESFKMKQKDILINNLIFILNAPAMNYLISVFSFNELREKYKLIISNISVKLPFSEVVILALIDRIEYDREGKILIDRFSAKSSQEETDDNLIIIDENSLFLIDPISFHIDIDYDQLNHVIIHYVIDQLIINLEQEEVKNLLEVFSFFKNFFISKNVNFESHWEFKSIKFSLRKPKSDLDSLNNDVIACIFIQSLSWEIILNESGFSSKIECQKIINSEDYDCKFINCNSPFCLSYKQIDKNVEAFITVNDIDLFLSPDLIMFNIDLYGISKLNIVNYEYVIQANNIKLALCSENDIFESIHLDEIRISSIQKGNFSFSFKNVKSLSKAFELPSFELQMINSVITYKMPDSCVQIETDSQKLDKFTKFFSDINLNLPSFLTFGIDININQIKIKLIDTNQLLSISNFIFKLNASEKIAVISVSEISYENLFSLDNFKVMIHFHVNDPNSDKKEIIDVFNDLTDISTEIDVKGDVLNPIHYEYINVLTKIDNLTIILNQRLYQKVKHLFNYHLFKLFNKRNNKWLIKEIKMNLSSFENEISFLLKNVDSYFSFNEKKFHLKINDADVLPGNLLTKKCKDETFISIHYDFCNQHDNYLSILIKESVLKLDINKFLSIYFLFDSINSLIPLSLQAEKMLFIFDNETGSPFHINLDFKISKNLQILFNNQNENETVFEFESNINSMNFVERKPFVQKLQLSIKVDNNRNLSISISDCSFLLSLFVRDLIKSLISQLKKLSFLIENFVSFEKNRFLINSVKMVTGKISIIFCKVSFQPAYRITLSPFSTYFSSKNENNESFDVFSSIDFVNDKINDWDYLVEPFKLTILPLLSIFKDEIRGGVYHSLNIKVDVNKNEEKKNLNMNLPLLLLQNNDMFDQEEKELFEKISKNNKLFELPDLFIKNNLNEQVTVSISPQRIYFIMVPQQLLPIYIDENPSLFEIKVYDKTFKFSLDEIIYPTILSTSLSIVKRGRRIELNSPVQIQSCIDRLIINLYEKGEGEYTQIASLEPYKLYPLYFNSNKPKECLFIIDNDKIKDKKHHTVLISPFDSEGDQNSVISGENNKNYYVLIHVDNDKSGKVVKMHSSVVCQNLLPFSLFIRVKNSKNENNEINDQLPICKNETIDLLSVNPENGSKFYAELSMNGIDYSSLNKLIIDISPSKETSIRESSSMNFLLDLNSESSLKLQTMTIFDCRIEQEITINVKFEKLSNGQIKMVLFSPFIFANLTDSDLMILNGSSITHLPIHNWSVLAPKSEGLIFTQKDDKIVLSVDGYEKQEIQYNPPNKKHQQKTYFQSLFLEKQEQHESNDEQQNYELQPRRKSSAFDSFINLFSKKNNDENNNNNNNNNNDNSNEDKNVRLMPLRLKITKHKICDETIEVVISDLITVQNDTDIQINFEYISVLPHSTSKIKNIRKIDELTFHFDGSDIRKTISLNNNHELNGSFRAAFLIEDNKKIEISVINQEVNLFISFKNSTFPTPLIITNELLDSNNLPISMNVYHTDPNKMVQIKPFTTSPFYFDDLQNIDSINAVILLNENHQTKSFSISLMNESSTTEINDSQHNLNFSITVKINQEKQLLKSVIFSSKRMNNKDDQILNYFRFKIDLNVPSIMTSIIDLNMNEILLISTKSFNFSIDNTINFDTFLTAFLNDNKLSFNQYGIQTICNFSIKSLQVDIQSNIIPRVFSPTIFKSNGVDSKIEGENLNENFVSLTFFSNSINRYLNVYLADSMSVSSDPLSLSFVMKIMKSLKNKISFGKFDWFEVSPFSFHFSYQETSINSESAMNRRRASFSISDVLNNNPKSTTVSIPGIVFGQFDGDFVNEVIQIYLCRFIKPSLATAIPGLQINIDKDVDLIDVDNDDNVQVLPDSDIMMTKKISENLTTSYGCVNRSSLVSLALSLVNEKIKTPQMMINIIAGLTSYSKNVKKLKNGFIFFFNGKNDASKSENNNENQSDNKTKNGLIPPIVDHQKQQKQWTRMPRCYPRFIIGVYDQVYSQILILIRNRFRNKERVRMVSKCTVTNDVVVLTDSYLIIISPTLEFITNEISILEIQSVAVVESELRIAGKKESEKMMLRLDSEKASKIFSIFIASQRLALGMFGMSMIDK